jgi:hypothetical protein
VSVRCILRIEHLACSDRTWSRPSTAALKAMNVDVRSLTTGHRYAGDVVIPLTVTNSGVAGGGGVRGVLEPPPIMPEKFFDHK